MPDSLPTPSLDEFRRLCEAHDLTFEYSDAGDTWRAGRASLARIVEAAKQFAEDDVARVWNEVVDRKMTPDYRAPFYWRRSGPGV